MPDDTIKSRVRSMSGTEQFLWLAAIVFFFPSTLLAVLIYIVLTSASGSERSKRVRRIATFVSGGVWTLTAFAWIILAVGALISGKPIL